MSEPTHFGPLIIEDPLVVAKRRLSRSDKRALIDVPPEQRAKVLERWSLRQFILDVRDGFKIAKRIKREASKKRNKKVDDK